MRRHADRRAVMPDEPLFGGNGGKIGRLRAAKLGEARDLIGFGQFRRFAKQSEQGFERDFGRSSGGIEFGAGNGIERSRLHRRELKLRIVPALLMDGGEHRAICLTLRGIELRRNAAVLLMARYRRPAIRRMRADRQADAQRGGEEKMGFHASVPPEKQLQMLPAFGLGDRALDKKTRMIARHRPELSLFHVNGM